MTASTKPARERVLDALARSKGATTTQELASQSGIGRRYVAAILSHLVASGEAKRLGRGLFAYASAHNKGPSMTPEAVHPSADAARLLDFLGGAGLRAQLTGYDVVGSYGNQLPASWPRLVSVQKGGGEWASDVLRSGSYSVLNDPSPEVFRSSMDLAPVGDLVVIRERSLSPIQTLSLASIEDAWVDLVAERRVGYPIGASELREILDAMASDISWTRLVRSARRRSIRVHLDPSRQLPIAADDPKDEVLRTILTP